MDVNLDTQTNKKNVFSMNMDMKFPTQTNDEKSYFSSKTNICVHTPNNIRRIYFSINTKCHTQANKKGPSSLSTHMNIYLLIHTNKMVSHFL